MSVSGEVKPPGRTGHVAVSHENYMFIWGGYRENPGDTENTYYSGCETWIYSYQSERWYLKTSPIFDSPPGMSGSTAVIIDDGLYLFGGYGYNDQGCTNKLFRLDLKSFVWENLEPTGSVPSPVDKMVGWEYDSKFYVFGGFGNPEDISAFDFEFVFYRLLWRGWTNQFFVYNPKTNSWTRPYTKGELPRARAAHAVAVLQDKAYIFGGRHDRNRLNDLHCLDMEAMEWSGEIAVRGPKPEGRSWHSLTALSKQCLILYGGFSQNNEPLSDCWMYDTLAQTWQPVELPFQKPRLWHCACRNIYDEILIFGGCSSNILEPQRIPEQDNEIILIRVSPKSLFRLCLDRMMTLPEQRALWSCLPQILQTTLRQKLRNITSNLDGS